MKSAIFSSLLLSLLASAGWAQASEPEWAEVRFHRVYLKNGNYIDGALIKSTEAGVTLRLKVGEITIRANQIDRVEFMKTRSINEKPHLEDLKKEEAVRSRPSLPPARTVPGESTPPVSPGAISLDPLVTTGFSKAVMGKVEEILARFKKDPGEAKWEILKEIPALGDEAILFVASNLGALEEDLLTSVGPILAQAKLARTRRPLTQALAHQNPKVRNQAVYILGELGDPGAASDLVPILGDADFGVRGQAVEALVKLGAREALDPVSKLCTHENRRLRERCLTGLRELLRKFDQEGDYVPILSRLLESAKGAARADIASALGNAGRPEAWSLLSPLLADPEPLVRQAAAAGLATLAQSESAPEIVGRLQVETDRVTRVSLANAAQRIGAKGAVEPLIRWLSDPDAAIRSAAHQTLRSLTSQPFDQDVQKWEKWFRENGATFR